MKEDLQGLLARAAAELPRSSNIIAISCFRSKSYQARIFNRRDPSETVLAQAYQVAPPGYSEHATGYVIDFGERAGRCLLSTCFATTDAGQWLQKNAPEFGFEMSFPKGNTQGVAFEPWHWRWVGRRPDEHSNRARIIFAAAHNRYPAKGRPVETPTLVAVHSQTAASPTALIEWHAAVLFAGPMMSLIAANTTSVLPLTARAAPDSELPTVPTESSALQLPQQ